MLATEGRYWHDAAVKAGKKILWRAIPRLGRRPAELGWSPARFVDEALNLTDEAHEPIRELVFANELDLNYERGDGEDDFDGLERRYPLIGGWALAVVHQLRQRIPGTRLHFPAWTPDHLATTFVGHWREAAETADVVDFHGYDSLSKIRDQYDEYRYLFPDKPLSLAEWHCKGDLAEEERVLQWLADTMASDPLFEAAYFFIWRWHNAPGWWSDGFDIEHNPERRALFMDPPVAALPEPIPVYPTPSRTPTYEEIRDGAIAVADGLGIPRRRLLGLCLAESGFGLQSFDRWASIERSKRMKTAIDAQDWRLAEAIFDEIKGTPTNDISFGPCHQSWWWSLTAEEQQAHPEWRHDLGRIMAFRARMIEDHGTALDTAGRKVLGAGSDIDLLCLYNKPAVPPIQNPNRPNYERSLAEADRLLALLEPAPSPDETRYESMPAAAAGTLARCDGVIFHGSRSGNAGNPLDREALGTARYCQSNALGLSWNATIGPGVVYEHLPVRMWGWNARAASNRYVAVEIAHPSMADDPNPCAIATADYIFDRVWPVWGEVWHFPSHSELELWGETGQKDGKSDLWPTGDERMNIFRDLVYTRLRQRQGGAQPEPQPEPEPSRAAVLVREIEERLQELKGLVA